jgi:hypothetical protein
MNTYIIAQHRQEAMDYIYHMRLDPSASVYVTSVDTLRGVRNPHGFFVGRWWARRDIMDIVQALQYSCGYGNPGIDRAYTLVCKKLQPAPNYTHLTYSTSYFDDPFGVIAKPYNNPYI